MLSDQKKINVFIPIELKKRELFAKVILSNFIINNKEKKTRCYIGSKSQIKKLISIKKDFGGVFIYKGGLAYDQIRKIKNKIEKFIILDEELGPAVDNLEKSMSKRLWEGTEKYVDRYYLIGKYAYDTGQKVYPKLSSKIIMTGWPRVDLWRPELNYIFDKSVKNLKNKYGNYILFSSDFSFNSLKRINREENYWKNFEWKSKGEKLSKVGDNARKVYSDYQKIIKLFFELDDRPDIPQIIIRPHPTDDLLEWRKISKSFKNIKVIFKGDVSHWIYASSGVLHRGCTTAIEAYMAGIKAGHIITNEDRTRKSLSYKLSEHLYNSEQIVEFCKNNVIKKPTPPKDYIDAFKSFIHVEKKFACEIIAEDMLKLDITSNPPFHHSKINYMLDSLRVTLNSMNTAIIRVIKRYTTGVLLPNKMVGGITKNEIDNILVDFNPNHKLKVRQVLKNCVEIE